MGFEEGALLLVFRLLLLPLACQLVLGNFYLAHQATPQGGWLRGAAPRRETALLLTLPRPGPRTASAFRANVLLFVFFLLAFCFTALVGRCGGPYFHWLSGHCEA